MKKIFILLCALFLFSFAFAKDKKTDKDASPQGDSFYQNFDSMDEELENALDADVPQEKEEYHRRAKKN